MRSLLCSIVLGLAATVASAQDPARVAPDVYKTVFENEYVTVVRVRYAPRVQVPEHDHPSRPTAYVYLTDGGPLRYTSRVAGRRPVTSAPVTAGSFRLEGPVQVSHRVESLSDTPHDFLRVEFRMVTGAAASTFQGTFARPAAGGTGSSQQVQFENDQVRITRLVCASGTRCLEVANASEPVLFVVLNTSRFTLGGTREITMRPGDTHWIASGTSVSGDNIGGTAAELLRVDVKPPRLGDSSQN